MVVPWRRVLNANHRDDEVSETANMLLCVSMEMEGRVSMEERRLTVSVYFYCSET